MRAPSLLAVSLLVCLALALPAIAQEGHPVKGSWLGTWGPSEDHTNVVVVIMDWDGSEITGMINPGTDNIPIENATLDPDGWVLHLEAVGEDRNGQELHYVIDGTIENLPFHDRFVTGTWSHETGGGPFLITRQ